MNPKRQSLTRIAIGSVVSPYRAGKLLSQRNLIDAIVLHIIYICVTATIAGVFFSFHYSHDPANFRQLIQSTANLFTAGFLKMSIWRALLGAAIVLVSFWALAICLLSSWAAIESTQSKQIRTGAILGAAASVWMIPLSLTILLAVHIILSQNTMMITRYLSLAMLASPVLTLVYSALALKLARGYGDATRKKIVNESDICEFCGYDLRATNFFSRCPECGKLARESISPVHRINGWECGQMSYWRTWLKIITRPDNFFKTLTARTNLDQARKFMALSCVYSSIAILLITMVLAVALPSYKLNISRVLFSRTMFRAGIGTIMWIYAAICIPILTATLINSALRRSNCPHASTMALKISCYLSCFSVWLSSLMTLYAITLGQLHAIGYSYDKASEMLRLPIIVAISLLFAWVWMVGKRGVKWLRWANR